jgi:hypothetical protein
LEIRIQIDNLNSSNITEIVYLSKSNNDGSVTAFGSVKGDLIVTFANNTKYLYSDLPLRILANCFDSQSFGVSWSKLIKPNYVGRRVRTELEN